MIPHGLMLRNGLAHDVTVEERHPFLVYDIAEPLAPVVAMIDKELEGEPAGHCRESKAGDGREDGCDDCCHRGLDQQSER